MAKECFLLETWEQRAHDIKVQHRHLWEYQSHLAHHHAEEEHVADELENLKDDEVVIVSDYKMKILAQGVAWK